MPPLPPPPTAATPSPTTHNSMSTTHTGFPYQHIHPKTGLLMTTHHRSNTVTWCIAILSLIFSSLLILSGIVTLVVFLVVRPRNPVFNTDHASLNVVSFNPPGNLNCDLTFLANFTNPNKKLNMRFEYAAVELYFDDSLIANQTISPFSQRQRETGVVNVHFVSSLVYLPLNHAMELQKQVLSNRVMYSVRGNFRVRASLGSVHFTYWLHGRCELQMSSPPYGSLIARSCTTKR